MKLSEITKRNRLHIVIFGAPKVGKTQLALEMAKYGYSLHVLDGEDGTSVGQNFLTPEQQSLIDVIKLPDTQNLPVMADTVSRVTLGGAKRICHKHGVVSCALCMKTAPVAFDEINVDKFGEKDILVIDSLTQLGHSIINHIGKNQPSEWKPGWEEYREQGRVLDAILSRIQVAPYHVICISHEVAGKDVSQDDKIFPIAGTTNFSRNVARYFGEVIYADVKNFKHIAASSSIFSSRVVTGSRSGVVLEKEKELSLLPFFEKVSAGATEKTEAQKMLESVKKEIGK